MSRVLIPLTDNDLAYIAEAPAEMTAAEIARRLGRPYFTVAKAVQRIRRNGWVSRLVWRSCAVCGEPLCSPVGAGRRVVHQRCRGARLAALERERRQGPHTPSTKYVADWRRRDPEGNARLRAIDRQRQKEKHRAEWTAEQWAPVLERVHTADRRDQEITVELAENRASVWTPDDDQYVLDHLKRPARDVALELGRTLWAVRGRRVRLRRLLRSPLGGDDSKTEKK